MLRIPNRFKVFVTKTVCLAARAVSIRTKEALAMHNRMHAQVMGTEATEKGAISMVMESRAAYRSMSAKILVCAVVRKNGKKYAKVYDWVK